LKIMMLIILVSCLVFPITAANKCLNWDNFNKQQRENKQQKEKEVYLFATGYYHPEEDQDFYATGSYEEDLELNGEGITASGKRVRKGHVAVDPSVIPLGTEFYSEKYGRLKAEDTGGRIKGNRIDIFTGNGEKGLTEALKIRGWLKLKIVG
jgi:3D (Asp-Asp-Asp) domain-containing protein